MSPKHQNKPSFQICLMQVAGKYKIARCLYIFNIISRKCVKRKMSVDSLQMQLKKDIIHSFMFITFIIIKVISNVCEKS